MKKIWTILILGIVLRIFLSLSTYHTDMEAFNLGGKVIASGNILNLYDYSSNLAVFNYPPLIYWFHGIFHFLLGNILSVNLLVKLPYLIFDLSIGLLLLRWFEIKSKALVAFTIWMFNPISLYATYMMGQFDIIPTFFTILSLYSISKDRLQLAALALGGAIAFKIYPVFLLLPLILLGKNNIEKFKIFILALLPYSISIIPYLPLHSFRSTALFATQNSKSLYANIAVSGGETILLFPLSLLIFYLFLFSKSKNLSVWKIYLMPLLLFFIFTHYHPQWLIWITPFLIISLTIQSKNIPPVLLMLFSWFGLLFFFDSSLTVNMFAPIFPSLANLPSVWKLLNINVDYNLSRSLLQTIFAASAFYFIYDNFQAKSNG